MADTMGVTQNANFIPEIWANRALGKLEAQLGLAKNVARDFEYVTQKEGDTVHIPVRGALTASQKTSGSSVTLQNPTATKVDVSLNQHWEVTFAVEDIAKAQANQDVMDGYISDAIIVLGEKIESTLAALYSSLTGSVVNSGGGDIVEDDILEARENLTNARAPQTDRFLYLDPAQVSVMLKIDRFTTPANYGSGEPIQTGELGKIHGFRCFESLFVPSAASPASKSNLALHRNAMVLAMRPLPEPKAPGAVASVIEKDGMGMRVIYSYNADQLADQVTLDILFGVGVLRSALGLVIQS